MNFFSNRDFTGRPVLPRGSQNVRVGEISMRSMKLALIGAAMCTMPTMADAALVGSLGRGTGPFLTLSSAGLNNG